MILTLSTTRAPATDLGWLLHKHPDRAHKVDLAFGPAWVVFPEAGLDRCTAALMLDIDPIGLVRGRDEDHFALRPYVNDRPYVASSFLAVALGRVFRTAMNARCDARPELVAEALPLTVGLPAVACSPSLLQRVFAPLGYAVRSRPAGAPETAAVEGSADSEAGEPGIDGSAARGASTGGSPVLAVTLDITAPLHVVLTHLYVLIPVLDDEKHYFVGPEEVEKLLAHGEGWLGAHPERDLIARRYLAHRGRLTRLALSRLAGEHDVSDPDAALADAAAGEETTEKPLLLAEIRGRAVVEALLARGAARVLDLGCGDGALLRRLLDERSFTEIVGVDVSCRTLEVAERRLHLEQLSEARRARIRLLQGSLTYRDERLVGFDAAAVVEVIEHLEPSRLPAFEDALLGTIAPATVVITTPNAEYNVLFPGLPAGRFRHADHRFEWTRAEFQAWATAAAARHGYRVRYQDVGPVHAERGAPTSMAVFTR